MYLCVCVCVCSVSHLSVSIALVRDRIVLSLSQRDKASKQSETGVGLKRAVGGQTELETKMSEQTGMYDSSALRSPARVMTGHAL